MNHSLENLLEQYHPTSLDQTKLALREIIQSLILIGLSKSHFFEQASFYGGTALRIFHGLNRFSEDLDFTLNSPNENFNLASFCESIIEVANSYGLNLEVEKKEKHIVSPVESAFAKVNTYTAFLSLKINSDVSDKLHKDEVMKVKFEVDTQPALGFHTEQKWILSPEFAPITVLDSSSLFAGKIHAVLCRNYKNNIKGRDYYDFLFYMSNGIAVNLEYLKNKLINSGKLKVNDSFDLDILKSMLKEKFQSVDIAQAMSDASKFLTEPQDLSQYTKELFLGLTDQLK